MKIKLIKLLALLIKTLINRLEDEEKGIVIVNKLNDYFQIKQYKRSIKEYNKYN